MLGAADGIEREAIDSSNLVSIGYDAARQVCAVEFKSGLIVHYSGVTMDAAVAFYGAASKGKFYAANIRGKYHAQYMTGPCSVCQATGIIGTECDACQQGKHFPLERRPEPTDADQVTR